VEQPVVVDMTAERHDADGVDGPRSLFMEELKSGPAGGERTSDALELRVGRRSGRPRPGPLDAHDALV
jgi:hypothetical protein